MVPLLEDGLARRCYEATQVPAGPAVGGLDDETTLLDRALGVAVGTAAAAESRPERLHTVLPARLPRLRRPHVLEHSPPAARGQHPPHLAEPARRVGHA